MGTPRGYVCERRFREEYRLPHSNDYSGIDTLRLDRLHAEIASAKLRDATRIAMFKWGSLYGITLDQASILLMDRRMP